MKKVIILLLVSLAITSVKAQHCEFSAFKTGKWVPMEFVKNKYCTDLILKYDNGSIIKDDFIAACDIDASGKVVGKGKNCPFEVGSSPSRDDWEKWVITTNNNSHFWISMKLRKTWGTVCNSIIENDLIVGTDNQNNIVAINPLLKIRTILMNANTPFGEKCTIQAAVKEGDNFYIKIVPHEDKKSVLDDSGAKIFTFEINTVRKSIIESNIKTFVNIYPNPAAKNTEITINIDPALGAKNFEILDLNGKLVKSGSVNEGESKLNIELGNKGQYICMLYLNNTAIMAGNFIVD